MPVIEFEEADLQEGEFQPDRVMRRRKFLAKVDSLLSAEDDLYFFDPSLQIGRQHPHNGFLRVQRFRARQTARGFNRDGHYLFEVEVEYSTDAPEEDHDQVNPLEIPATISADTMQITRVVERDADGNPIVNTAGSRLLELNEEFDLWRLQVSKNIPRFPPWAKQYAGAVNSDTVRIDGETFAPRTLKFSSPRLGPRDVINDIPFRPLAFSLVHNEQTWDRFLLNRGFEEIEVRSVTNPQTQQTEERLVRVPIQNPDGEYISDPAFLDEQGRAFRDDAANVRGLAGSSNPLQRDEIIVLRFRTRKQLPFSVLPLR
jgi:hypothetical protein